jgi:hypothetical protein
MIRQEDKFIFGKDSDVRLLCKKTMGTRNIFRKVLVRIVLTQSGKQFTEN